MHYNYNETADFKELF